MQSFAPDAVTRSFLAMLEPTGEYPGGGPDWQISRAESAVLPNKLRELAETVMTPRCLLRKPRHKRLALFLQFPRNHAAEGIKKLFVLGQFLLPFFVVDTENFDNVFVLHDLDLEELDDNPFEHAHVFAETGPQEISLHAFAEPIYMKNERRIREAWREISCGPVSAKTCA